MLLCSCRSIPGAMYSILGDCERGANGCCDILGSFKGDGHVIRWLLRCTILNL